MRRRPSFQAVGSVLAYVVMLSAAGCGEDERSVTGATAGAVEPTAAFGPGTGLGDGFEVAEGSTLIGAPIPLGTTVVFNGEPIVDDGWRAFLYVDGEPEAGHLRPGGGAAARRSRSADRRGRHARC